MPRAQLRHDWWYWDLTLRIRTTSGDYFGGTKIYLDAIRTGTEALGKSITDVFGTNYLKQAEK